MDLDNHTDSALTTEPDDLTALHQLSGLQTEHHSRRTKTGFVVRESRLPNCVALPAEKKPPRSWIWRYGHRIGRRDDHNEVLKHWLCKICYHKATPPMLSTYILPTAKNTTKIIDHLEDLYQFDRSGNKLHTSLSKKRKQESLEGWAQQHDKHNTVFDEEGWKSIYCR